MNTDYATLPEQFWLVYRRAVDELEEVLSLRRTVHDTALIRKWDAYVVQKLACVVELDRVVSACGEQEYAAQHRKAAEAKYEQLG